MTSANQNWDAQASDAQGSPTEPANWSISWFAIVLTALVSLAMIGLNHDFDVIGGRFEEAVTAGGGLDHQAEFEQSVGSADLNRKLGFLMLLAVGALAFMGPKSDVRLRLGVVAVLAAAALGWTTASWIWSTGRSDTARELIRLFVYAFTAVALVRRLRLHEIVFMFLAVSVASIVVDCAADIAAGTFRPWTTDFRMGGTLHPNHMGRLGAIVALFGFAALGEPHLRRWSWLLMGAGITVVVFSGSRSGLLGLLAGLAAIQFIGLAGRRLALAAVALAALASAGVLLYSMTPPSVHRQAMQLVLMGRTDDATSLTGRMPLWQEMWRDSAGRRWNGFGYGAYWTADRNHDIASAIQWFPHHSHSAYMEFFIDLGFVGAALIVALAVACIFQYRRLAVATGRTEYRFLGALIVCALANSFLEVGFSVPRFEGLFMAMVVLVPVIRWPAVAGAAVANRLPKPPTPSWSKSLDLPTGHASWPTLRA